MADSSHVSQAAAIAGSTGVAIARTAPNHYAVSGALTFATARSALSSGIEAFKSASAGPLDVDFSGVDASDSAGLAVLVEWLAWARRNGRELRYSRVPEAICAIARISEVDGLLLQR
jgi:phospholipid transport system transporter-binding protein